MSDIVWCDIGGHPFSAAEEGRKFWTQPGNEYGTNQAQARLDACAEHSNFTAKMPNFVGPSRSAINSGMQQKKIEHAREHDYDPDYVKWLEAQADKPLPTTAIPADE